MRVTGGDGRRRKARGDKDTRRNTRVRGCCERLGDVSTFPEPSIRHYDPSTLFTHLVPTSHLSRFLSSRLDTSFKITLDHSRRNERYFGDSSLLQGMRLSYPRTTARLCAHLFLMF